MLYTNSLFPFGLTCHASSAWVSVTVRRSVVQLTRRESQIAVFHHLREEEAFLVVNLAASVPGIHIGDARVSRVSAAVIVDGNEGVPDPLPVLEVVRAM